MQTQRQPAEPMFTRRWLVVAIVVAALCVAHPVSAQDKPGQAQPEQEKPGPEKPRQEKLKVVATFSILADLVQNVGSDRVDMSCLVGPSGDTHVYSPAPADARKLAAARAVFINGLGFEGWLGRLIQASGTKAPTFVATVGIQPLERAARSGASQHERDPHAWQSVANAKVYITNIRDGLIAVDPPGKAVYEANAAAYLARLDALDGEVKAIVARIPPGRRKVMASHDAFGYFSAAYGIEILGAQGVSTEAEASARDVASLVAQIRSQNVAAVFLDNISQPYLVERIAKETGARIGGTLYSDTLTDPGGPAGSYIDMIRHNVDTLGATLGN